MVQHSVEEDKEDYCLKSLWSLLLLISSSWYLWAVFVLTLALCLNSPSFGVIRNLKIFSNTFPFLILSNLGPKTSDPTILSKLKEALDFFKIFFNRTKPLLSLSVSWRVGWPEELRSVGVDGVSNSVGCYGSWCYSFGLLYIPLLTLALFGVCGCLYGFLSGLLRFVSLIHQDWSLH